MIHTQVPFPISCSLGGWPIHEIPHQLLTNLAVQNLFRSKSHICAPPRPYDLNFGILKKPPCSALSGSDKEVCCLGVVKLRPRQPGSRQGFRVLSVLFNGALLGKGFQILSSLKQEKPPEYPRGLFLCPGNVRQAVSQRLYSPGRARYCGRGLPPWGESGGRTLRHISRITVAPRTFFYLSGGSGWPSPCL